MYTQNLYILTVKHVIGTKPGGIYQCDGKTIVFLYVKKYRAEGFNFVSVLLFMCIHPFLRIIELHT